MKTGIHHVLAKSTAAALLGAVLSLASACSVLPAAENPKALWAVDEPAPMYIVVRRADVAAATAREVNRLLAATPVGADSDWTGAVGPDPKVAASEMTAIGRDPMYAASRARVLAAEVWMRTLPQLRSTTGDKPNLLAAIDPSLGDAYTAIVTKKQEIAIFDAVAETEKEAASAGGVSADDKTMHDGAAAKAEAEAAKLGDEVAPLAKTFLASIKATAAKVSPDTQAKFAPVIANLLQAIDDADLSNSAATARYPLAFPTSPDKVVDAVKAAVPYIVADVLAEKTGVYPSFAKLDVQVSIHGGSLVVVLDGIGPGERARLDVADVTAETIKRTGAWLAHATTLLGAASSTQQEIDFEHAVLTRLQSGFTPPASVAVYGAGL